MRAISLIAEAGIFRRIRNVAPSPATMTRASIPTHEKIFERDNGSFGTASRAAAAYGEELASRIGVNGTDLVTREIVWGNDGVFGAV